MDEEGRSFLKSFLEEFPAPLDEDRPLPVCPLSPKVTREELQGESLELGLRLLTARGAPGVLSAHLCRAALTRLLHSDLSPFHCPQETGAEPEEVLLDSQSVQRLFINQLIESALTWQQDSPAPPPPKLRPCSVHAIRNVRRKMEDKHVVLAEFNQLFGIQDGVDRSYYGVFDGHGGVSAAAYAAAHLHVTLSRQETLQSAAGAALKTAFKHTDDMFRLKAKRERLRSGSTGLVLLIQGPELTLAWLGDSQALLVRDGRVETLTDPHKPEREDERQRIEELGGCVTFMGCWRVNGTYAVSRAIGDWDQKPYVSSEADCSSVRLRGDEDYVLLACDGFFDTVQPSMVPDLVLEALQEPVEPEGGAGAGAEGGAGAGDSAAVPVSAAWGDTGLRVAQHLVSAAKSSGSSDNITVMVVFLRPPQLLLLPSPDSGSHDAQL